MNNQSNSVTGNIQAALQALGRVRNALESNQSLPDSNSDPDLDFKQIISDLDQETLQELQKINQSFGNILNKEFIVKNLDAIENPEILIDPDNMIAIDKGAKEFLETLYVHTASLREQASTIHAGNETVAASKTPHPQAAPKSPLEMIRNILDSMQEVASVPEPKQASTNTLARQLSENINSQQAQSQARPVSLTPNTSENELPIKSITYKTFPEPASSPVTQNIVAPAKSAAQNATLPEAVKPVTPDPQAHQFSASDGKEQGLSRDARTRLTAAAPVQSAVSEEPQLQSLTPFQQISQRIISHLRSEALPQNGSDMQQYVKNMQQQPKPTFLDVQLKPDGLGIVNIRMSISSNQLNVSLNFSEHDTAQIFKRDEQTLLSIIKNSDLNLDDVVLRITESNRTLMSPQRDLPSEANNNNASFNGSLNQDRNRSSENRSHYEQELTDTEYNANVEGQAKEARPTNGKYL